MGFCFLLFFFFILFSFASCEMQKSVSPCVVCSFYIALLKYWIGGGGYVTIWLHLICLLIQHSELQNSARNTLKLCKEAFIYYSLWTQNCSICYLKHLYVPLVRFTSSRVLCFFSTCYPGLANLCNFSVLHKQMRCSFVTSFINSCHCLFSFAFCIKNISYIS